MNITTVKASTCHTPRVVPNSIRYAVTDSTRPLPASKINKGQEVRLLVNDNETRSRYSGKAGLATSATPSVACYAYKYMDNQIQATDGVAEVASPALPEYRDLVSLSFTKSLTSWPLFILLAVSGIVLSVTAYLIEFGTTLGVWQVLALTVVMFIALYINVLGTVVAVKYFLNDGTEKISTYFSEVSSSAWSYLWVLSLSTLVLFSGFIMFIIPGIILSTYLMFALHTRAAESATGMDSLVRSTELVRGYWWAVTARLIFLSVGFALGILASIVGLTQDTADLISLLAVEPIFSALGSIICLYAITVMYKALVAMKAGVVAEPNAVRGWYIGLAILTPLLMVAVLALVLLGFMNEFDFVDPAQEGPGLMETEATV